MARAIWSGAISFGLVNIPVKLYSAVSKKTVRFHQLDAKTGSRISQKRVNPQTGEEVPYEQLVKGYELSPDRFVVITPEELEAIEPKKTRTIDIEDFVDIADIDPIYYDHPYYLAPGTGAAKSYALLLQAMEDSGKVGIARVVIRSKEQLVALRPRGEVMTMETLLFGDEVVDPGAIGDLPDSSEVKASEREVDMARQLIASLASDFDPSKYQDTYREAVLGMIERKADGEEIAIQPDEEEPAAVPDLMAALEASIAGAKRQGGSSKPKEVKSESSKNGSSKNGSSTKSSTAKKKPAAKKSAAKKTAAKKK
ncbi:MAG: Ku protein [Thermoleophilaceae bacterium]|nr:Ku protein [Thermoleophilaceae bacterium]